MATDDPFADIGTKAKADDPFADIGTPNAAQDFLKQLGSGLVTGVEAIPTLPAQAAGFLGGLVEKIPGMAPSEAQAQRRQELLKIIEENRKGGIAQYLPQPETTAGQYGRTIGETIPAFVAGTRGINPLRAAVAGTTAGAASEAAGQATEGTAAEPFARVGATLTAGTVALRQAERAAARAATPTIAQLETRGGQLYDQFRASGLQYSPTVSPQFSQALKAELQGRGLTDSDAVAGATWRALTRGLEDKAATTPQDFHSIYQELGHIARGAGANAGQGLSANIAQERRLQFMEQTPQGALTGNVNAPAQAVEWLREANRDWAAAQRAKNVSQRIVKAEQKAGSTFSGLNLENELRRRVGAMADPEIAQRAGFSQAEQAAIQRFGEGTAGPNYVRYLGNVLAGGGGSVGIGAAGGIGGGIGAGISYATGGDPLMGALYGATAPLAGLGMRLASNRWALARARELETMLRARSPLAAQTMPRIADPAAPFVATGLAGPLQLTVRPSDRTLATLGE